MNFYQGGPPFPWWWDFLWLGPISIPPLPAVFGMTDRATGTVWYPTVSADGTHLVFTTQAPVGANVPVKVYGPYDGPFVGQYGLRLGISNGHVVADQQAGDFGAGPFLRCAISTALMAVLTAQRLAGGALFDHISFQSAPTTGSIF